MTGALIDTGMLVARRTALNLSQRALSRQLGVSQVYVHVMEANPQAHASMTLGELARLAQALAVTPAELLRAPQSSSADPPAPDVAILLAALMDEAKATLIHRDDLAHALGWSLERVKDAARDAAEHLPALGLKLHEHPAGGLAIRTQHGVLEPDAQQQLARAKTQRTTVPADQARVLSDVAHGGLAAGWTRTLTRNQRVPIQALTKRGLIKDTPTGLQLTATAAYNLLLTDEPPADPTEGPPQAPITTP
ncbi:MAG: helix-turn-helix transcriptional regulator [Actinomycetota bacterium]|nr:helix-turn-helix transcriptional regulator [Actinomycetota bacterium]